jgi:thioredoxin-like negative regulator of GroEL
MNRPQLIPSGPLAWDSWFAILKEVTDLTHSSFWEFVRTHRFAVIHFWASWNGYDVKMRELLDQDVPPEFRSHIAFGALSIDPEEHWEISRQHKIVNLPFLAFYRDGTLIRTQTGMLRQDDLIEYLRQLTA